MPGESDPIDGDIKPIVILDGLVVTPLFKAAGMLFDALAIAQTPLEKAGAIQCFEYCFELAWKTLRRILATRGLEVNSPREAFRTAAIDKLIDNSEVWFEFVKKRNLTMHTYDEEVAEEVFASLPGFAVELRKLLAVVEGLG